MEVNATQLYDSLVPVALAALDHYPYAGYAAVITFVLLFVSMCSSNDSTKVQLEKTTSDEIHSRNAKLAVMLMMLLLESPEENQKYIRLARSIGCNHLLREISEETN